jgi:hypothetical protein
MLGKGVVSELDILDDGNSWTYWSRSDAHTMALNMGSNPKSRQGFCRAIEAFIRHLLNVEVTVEPLSAVEDHNWRWFVGLDAEGTSIGPSGEGRGGVGREVQTGKIGDTLDRRHG